MGCESRCGAGAESRGWMRQHEICPRAVVLPDGRLGFSLGNRGGRINETLSGYEPMASHPGYWKQKVDREGIGPEPEVVIYEAPDTQAAQAAD